MKYIFIVNPKSRSGKGKQIWNQIEPELLKERVDFDVYFTKYQKHAEKLAAEITSDGDEHTLVVLGGDGTINEVVNGIRNLSAVTLGYIPSGSGNDFTRSLKLPCNPKKALQNVLAGTRTETLDIGTVTAGVETRRFAVSAGIGFDAGVCWQIRQSMLKKWLNMVGLGSLSYVGVALSQLAKEKMSAMTVSLDNGEVFRLEKTLFVAVMNHPYEGGGFFFCPEAKVNDGMLDVIAAAGIPKWKMLYLLPKAYKGKHVGYKGIHIFKCREVRIEAESGLPVHTDGECAVRTDVLAAGLDAGRFRVIVP